MHAYFRYVRNGQTGSPVTRAVGFAEFLDEQLQELGPVDPVRRRASQQLLRLVKHKRGGPDEREKISTIFAVVERGLTAKNCKTRKTNDRTGLARTTEPNGDGRGGVMIRGPRAINDALIARRTVGARGRRQMAVRSPLTTSVRNVLYPWPARPAGRLATR